MLQDNTFERNIASPDAFNQELIQVAYEYHLEKQRQNLTEELVEGDNGAGRRLQEDGKVAIPLDEAFDIVVDYLKDNVYPNHKNIDAGAIYFTCPPDEEKNDGRGCNVKLQGNEFEANVAGNKGGALRWVNTRFNMETDEDGADTNTYEDNWADYGPIQASYPSKIRYTMQWEGRDEEDIDNENRIIDIAPGQSFDLILTILD